MRNPLKVRITFWMHTGTAVGKYYLEEGCTAGLQRSVTAFRQLNLNSPILHGKRLPQKYFNVEKACCRKQGMRPDSSTYPDVSGLWHKTLMCAVGKQLKPL